MAEPSILKAGTREGVGRAVAPVDDDFDEAPTRIRSVEHDAPQIWVAGFWRRAAAGLVDLAIVGPIAWLLVRLAAALSAIDLPVVPRAALDFWLDLTLAGDPALLGALGLAAVLAFLYLLVFHALGGRTLGMRLLRLRVVDAYGDAPGPLRAAVRALGYFLCAATGGLGFLWVGFDREKRGLHDWIAGTYVARRVDPATPFASAGKT